MYSVFLRLSCEKLKSIVIRVYIRKEHREAINAVIATEKYKKSLAKIKITWKNYHSKKIIFAIMRNGVCMLLYHKVPKHPIWSETPQYQSEGP